MLLFEGICSAYDLFTIYDSDPLQLLLLLLLLLFQGICSAYDLIIICNLDPLQLLGLRKSEQIIESIGPTIDRNNNWKVCKNYLQITEQNRTEILSKNRISFSEVY